MELWFFNRTRMLSVRLAKPCQWRLLPRVVTADFTKKWKRTRMRRRLGSTTFHWLCTVIDVSTWTGLEYAEVQLWPSDYHNMLAGGPIVHVGPLDLPSPSSGDVIRVTEVIPPLQMGTGRSFEAVVKRVLGVRVTSMVELRRTELEIWPADWLRVFIFKLRKSWPLVSR
jgi:hypothetical protein